MNNAFLYYSPASLFQKKSLLLVPFYYSVGHFIVYTYTRSLLIHEHVVEHLLTGERNNQDQIWCVNIGENNVFGVFVGSHYCAPLERQQAQHSKTRHSTAQHSKAQHSIAQHSTAQSTLHKATNPSTHLSERDNASKSRQSW